MPLQCDVCQRLSSFLDHGEQLYNSVNVSYQHSIYNKTHCDSTCTNIYFDQPLRSINSSIEKHWCFILNIIKLDGKRF